MWLGGGSPAKWDPAVNMVQSYLIVNNAANTEPGQGKVDNFREIYDVECTELAQPLQRSEALARAAWRGCVFSQTSDLIISSNDVV